MSAFALVLILCSAVMHATWNALARRTDEPYAFFFAFSLASVVFWVPIPIFLGSVSEVRATDVLLVIGSGSLQVIYYVLLSSAYRHGDLSLVYPVARGTGVAIVPVAGIVIFGERPTFIGWLGIGATLAGLILIAVASRGTAGMRGPEQTRLALIFALLTGLTVTTYSLVDNFGVERVNPVVYGYGLILAAVVLQTPYVVTRRRAAVMRQFRLNRRAVSAGAVLSMATYLLVLVAFSESNVGYVVPLRETSIIFALIIGVTVLRELPSFGRVVAAVVVAAGAILIAIGG
jgi:uncharacterized membrane protein